MYACAISSHVPTHAGLLSPAEPIHRACAWRRQYRQHRPEPLWPLLPVRGPRVCGVGSRATSARRAAAAALPPPPLRPPRPPAMSSGPRPTAAAPNRTAQHRIKAQHTARRTPLRVPRRRLEIMPVHVRGLRPGLPPKS